MPARTFSRVLLPAPLWPMIPTRSPSRTSRLRCLSASTSITGLVDFLYSRRTRNSLRVMRACWRTRKVRLTLSRWIRAIRGSLGSAPAGRGDVLSELEDQLPLAAGQGVNGTAHRDGDGEARHREGEGAGVLGFQD